MLPHETFLTILARTKMERGISRAVDNEYLVNQARTCVASDYLPPKFVEAGLKEDQQSCCNEPSDSRNSPDSPDSGASVASGLYPGNLFSGGFIETPVYTFTLPDLSCYPGKLFYDFIFLKIRMM